MSHADTLLHDRFVPPSSASRVVALVVAVWLGLIAWLGAIDAFAPPPGQPALPLLAAVLGPIAIFFVAYRTSHRVRDLVLGADVRLLTATQAWRFGGFVFLALYTYRVLPAYFAWPAGLGDMAVGITALSMLWRLERDPAFVASRGFAIWNALGILDLVVAVSAGAVVPLIFPAAAQDIPTTALTRLPLVLVPGLFVPGFVILHVIALIQRRAAAGVSLDR